MFNVHFELRNVGRRDTQRAELTSKIRYDAQNEFMMTCQQRVLTRQDCPSLINTEHVHFDVQRIAFEHIFNNNRYSACGRVAAGREACCIPH